MMHVVWCAQENRRTYKQKLHTALEHLPNTWNLDETFRVFTYVTVVCVWHEHMSANECCWNNHSSVFSLLQQRE